jgi:hypothetical protein
MFVFRLDDSRQLPQLLSIYSLASVDEHPTQTYRLYYVGGGLHVGQEVEDILSGR